MMLSIVKPHSLFRCFMLSVVLLSVIMLSVIMLSVVAPHGQLISVIRAEYFEVEFCYVECHILFITTLNVIMLSVIMLSVIMLSVIMPNVVASHGQLISIICAECF
jgi:hypothetical protein